VILRYTVGFRRDRHSMALSFIATATNRHVNVVARALKELERRKIIKKYKSATFRLPAQLGIRPVEEWLGSPHKVRLTASGDTQLRPESMTVATGSGSTPTRQGDSGSLHEVIGDSLHEVTKIYKNRNSYKKEREKNTLLKRFPRGTIADCTKSAQSAVNDIPSFSQDKKAKAEVERLSASKHPFRKESLRSLVEIYGAKRGREATLTKSELGEVQRIWQNHHSFVQAFTAQIQNLSKDIKTPREADSFMEIVRSLKTNRRIRENDKRANPWDDL
jgi:hypothetical protein